MDGGTGTNRPHSIDRQRQGGRHEELDTFDRPTFIDGSNDVHDATMSRSRATFPTGIWMGAPVQMDPARLIDEGKGGQHEELDTFDRPTFVDGSNDVHDATTSCSRVAFLMGIWMGALLPMDPTQLIDKGKGGWHEELDTFDRPVFINGFTNDTHDATTSHFSVRDLDGGTSINDLLTLCHFIVIVPLRHWSPCGCGRH